MEFLLLKHVRRTSRTRDRAQWASYVCILLGALVLSLDGIGRSLWLDEAWVANSVRENSLEGMFYYPEWLQTTPPLFLLGARFFVYLFGLFSLTFRIYSLFFALSAAAAMLAVSRRVVSAPVALLTAALLMFHPLPVEYFRSFKQYGAEIAATAGLLLAAVAYLQSPGRREFLWLLGAATLLLPLSYPIAFLLPGIILAVWFSGPEGRARAAALAGLSAATLGVLLAWFILPNVSPVLWTFWLEDPDPRYGGGTTVVAIGAAVALYAGWRVAKRGVSWREWTLAVGLLPGGLLLLAEVAGWYPASPRTHLFVRPCYLLALAIAAEDFLGWVRNHWKHAPAAVTLTAIAVMGWGLEKQFAERRGEPHEDYIAAIGLLRDHMTPGDLLLVHPSAREGFRLYAAMGNWQPAVVYGDTGWPCCARERPAGPRSSTEELVRQDLDAKVPKQFEGRIWLLYTDRPLHWDYTGVGEGDLWRRLLAERGCLPGKYEQFPNLVVHHRICPANTNSP